MTSRRADALRRDVFISVTGARGNVGDTALRRHLLGALRGTGRAHLYVGTLPDTYLAGLALDESDVLYRSRRRWRAQAMRSAVAGRVLFAFHGGEITLSASVIRMYLLVLPVLLAARLRGGGAVHTSIGIRAPRRLPAAILRSVLTLCDVVTWRDEESRSWVGVGTVTPDWAFAPGDRSGASDEPRTLLAVALRHDRPPPSPDYVAVVRALAETHGLDVVMTAQTDADLVTARRWAPMFGAPVLDWATPDLADAERDLRRTYRRCRIVVSNRLHGLIIAATEGAVPLGFGTSDVEKLDRGMRAVGLTDIAHEVVEQDRTLAIARSAVERSDDVRLCVDRAALELDVLTHRIAAVAGGAA